MTTITRKSVSAINSAEGLEGSFALVANQDGTGNDWQIFETEEEGDCRACHVFEDNGNEKLFIPDYIQIMPADRKLVVGVTELLKPVGRALYTSESLIFPSGRKEATDNKLCHKDTGFPATEKEAITNGVLNSDFTTTYQYYKDNFGDKYTSSDGVFKHTIDLILLDIYAYYSY